MGETIQIAAILGATAAILGAAAYVIRVLADALTKRTERTLLEDGTKQITALLSEIQSLQTHLVALESSATRSTQRLAELLVLTGQHGRETAAAMRTSLFALKKVARLIDAKVKTRDLVEGEGGEGETGDLPEGGA